MVVGPRIHDWKGSQYRGERPKSILALESTLRDQLGLGSLHL